MTIAPAAPDREQTLRRRIRALILVFIVGLILSGLTAIPVESEMDFAGWVLGLPPGAAPQDYSGLQHWIALVRLALHDTGERYPFIAYGFDWLAFSHIVIAVAFIGPLRDPVRNVWVLTFGMIAAAMVIPWAIFVSPFRGIPFYWSLIDCSFGVCAFIPLWICRRWTTELARLSAPADA